MSDLRSHNALPIEKVRFSLLTTANKGGLPLERQSIQGKNSGIGSGSEILFHPNLMSSFDQGIPEPHEDADTSSGLLRTNQPLPRVLGRTQTSSLIRASCKRIFGEFGAAADAFGKQAHERSRAELAIDSRPAGKNILKPRCITEEDSFQKTFSDWQRKKHEKCYALDRSLILLREQTTTTDLHEGKTAAAAKASARPKTACLEKGKGLPAKKSKVESDRQTQSSLPKSSHPTKIATLETHGLLKQKLTNESSIILLGTTIIEEEDEDNIPSTHRNNYNPSSQDHERENLPPGNTLTRKEVSKPERSIAQLLGRVRAMRDTGDISVGSKHSLRAGQGSAGSRSKLRELISPSALSTVLHV